MNTQETKTESKYLLKEPLNLLVTIDKNYLNPLCVMLRSYEQTHKGIRTNVFVVHSSLTENDFSVIKDCVNEESIVIHNVKIQEKHFDEIPVLERLGAESFYRILAFEFLPKEVKRCLYLDPDIVVRRSLLPLYYTDLGNYYIAGASHTYGFNNFFNRIRLGIFERRRYVNSGVMLMNLEEIRKDFTADKVFVLLNKTARILFMGDQDLCNILFSKKLLPIDELLYNLDERTFRHNKRKYSLDDVSKKTVIIHYNGKNKPWLNGYKGVLNRFYPETEKAGNIKKCIVFARIKSILCILFFKQRKKKTK